jgi:CheY-like chemotaxis protein
MTPHRRVLIVDDDRDICETMEEILRLAGYEPSVALSGAAALAALRHASFDVVLLDIRMPEMDGIETLRRLRELDAALPVIMHTAYGVDARVRQALDLGARGVVVKPLQLPQLFALLDSLPGGAGAE